MKAKSVLLLLALVLSIPGVSMAQAPTNGLVSWWQAESNTLDTLNQNNGVAVGTVNYATAGGVPAFSLNGSSYLSVANPTLVTNTGSFTVAAWIEISSYSSGAPIINLRDPGNSSGFTLEQHYGFPGEVLWAVNQTGVGEGFTTLTATNWQLNTLYHIAATFDSASGTMAIYQNGVLVAITNGLAHANMATNAADTFQIGHNIVASQFSWYGLIGDARYYDRALSAGEIAALAYGGSPATLFTVSQNDNAVYRYQVAPLGAVMPITPITNALLNVPTALAVSPDNELFVVNIGGSPSGGGGTGWLDRFLNPVGTPIFNGTISNGFNTPVGATIHNSDLFVVDAWNNRVRHYAFDNLGNAVETTAISNGLTSNAPRFVKVSPSGNELFVSQSGSPDEVNRFLIGSNGTITANGTINSGLNNPHGLAFSSSGELFVVNAYGQSISRFVFSNGVAIPNGTISGNGLSQPIGLTFSPWGELFVANQTSPVISRWIFDTNGAAIANGTFAVPVGMVDVAFVNSISGVAFQPSCTNITFNITNVVVNTGSPVITSGLVGWWLADNNANDSFGTNNGTLFGSVTYVPGVSGEAFNITTNNQPAYVSLGQLPGLDNAAGFSATAYVNLSPNGTNGGSLTLFSEGGAVGECGLGLYSIADTFALMVVDGNQFQFNLPFGSVVTGSSGGCTNYQLTGLPSSSTGFGTVPVSIPTNQWVHLAATWESSDGLASVYVNGVLAGTTNLLAGLLVPPSTNAGAVLAPGSIFRLNPSVVGSVEYGAANSFGSSVVPLSVSGLSLSPGTYPSQGLVDGLRVYNRALSAAEIQQVMAADAGLVATNMQFCTTASSSGGTTGIMGLQISNAPPGQVNLFWPSQTNAWYLLEGSDGLAPLNWLNVWGPGPGNGSVELVPDATTTRPHRFYRLLSTQ